MHELSEKHLQTLKKQIEDANVAGHRQAPVTRRRQPPVTGSHRSRPAAGYRQAAADRNVNLRTRRR